MLVIHCIADEVILEHERETLFHKLMVQFSKSGNKLIAQNDSSMLLDPFPRLRTHQDIKIFLSPRKPEEDSRHKTDMFPFVDIFSY